MPGIAGIFAAAPSAVHEGQVRQMLALMRHQPDSCSGMMFASDLGTYGGWVAHAHSFAAQQSCSASSDGAIRLAFAGECFGDEPPDSGSLIRSYEERGEDFVSALNGTFSGLLVDLRNRRAILFNDRYGGERLYAFERNGALYFASEAKALLSVLPELRAFDDVGVAQFLAFGSTSDGHTLFKGLKFLPGASLLRFLPGAPALRSLYFKPSDWENLSAMSGEDFETELAAVMRTRVPRYLHGKNDVGLSLTGGLDTRMIVASLPRNGDLPRVAYTYATEGAEQLLDLTIGRRVAQARGIPHHPLFLGPEFLTSFGRQLDRTVFISDGCAGVLAAHELTLSEKASSLAPVRLTGNFGSEILRCASTFKPSGPGSELLDPTVFARVETAVAQRHAHSLKVHPVTRAAFEEVPWHLFGAPAVSRSQLTVRTPFLDNAIVQLAYRAPAQLRQNSRLALRLVQGSDPALAAIPTDRGLAAATPGLREIVRRFHRAVTFKLDYWHKDGLPDALLPADGLLASLSRARLLGLHKFLAYRVWFRGELSPYLEDVIHDSRTAGLPFWDRRALRRIALHHRNGRRNCLREIHSVLTLEAVHRQFIDADAYRVNADGTPRVRSPL